MFSKLDFVCNICGHDVCQEIFVPDTNMEENEGAFSDDVVECPICKQSHYLDINNRGGVVIVTINGVSSNDISVSALYPISEDYEEENWRSDYEWYSSVRQKNVFQYFVSSINSLRRMLDIYINDRNQHEVFNRMLLVQSIATMEAYLSDTLISRIVTEPDQLRKLYKIDKELKKERYAMSEILDDEDLPKKIAKKYLTDLIYHNLPKIEVLYKNILDAKFDFGDQNKKERLYQAIQVRHDCVHRNGKTKDGGSLVMVDREYVFSIIDTIENFISNLERKLEYNDGIPF